jgi:hypothetical protein
MEEIIEQYLLRKKYCPLPAVGTLEINMKPAQAIFSEHRMHAPVPEITLLRKELPADHFIQFIAAEKNITIAEPADHSKHTAVCYSTWMFTVKLNSNMPESFL